MMPKAAVNILDGVAKGFGFERHSKPGNRAQNWQRDDGDFFWVITAKKDILKDSNGLELQLSLIARLAPSPKPPAPIEVDFVRLGPKAVSALGWIPRGQVVPAPIKHQAESFDLMCLCAIPDFVGSFLPRDRNSKAAQKFFSRFTDDIIVSNDVMSKWVERFFIEIVFKLPGSISKKHEISQVLECNDFNNALLWMPQPWVGWFCNASPPVRHSLDLSDSERVEASAQRIEGLQRLREMVYGWPPEFKLKK
jgi:hypothetical protein